MAMKTMTMLSYLPPILFFVFHGFFNSAYTPDWPSIDSRPVPAWFDDIKFGIFSHWGVYSVPAFDSEWFWWNWQHDKNPAYIKFMESHYPNGTTYGDFGSMFTAEDFDAHEYAEIVKASGARYFVLTSKHHEGFTMWPSATSWNWNSVDIGPHRDLVQEMADGIRSKGLHFGLYFSEMDWFHPLYLNDKKTGRKDFPQQVQYPQLLEIVNKYHPEIIWSDGDQEMPETYWRARDFLAWLYNESPVKDVVCANDRWGIGMVGKHGGFMTYGDHYDPGHLQPRKWENCLKLDKHSWGYRRGIKAQDVLTLKEIITQLVRTIACGGNMLLNIGPDHRGRIVPIFEERLRALGQWMGINQEAVYGTKPWIHQADGINIWYTSKVINDTGMDPHRLYNRQDTFNTVIYAFLLQLPRLGRIWLPSVITTDKTQVTILGTTINVPVKKGRSTLWVDLSGIPWKDLPSLDVLVLKVEYAASSNAHPIIRKINVAMRPKLKNQPSFIFNKMPPSLSSDGDLGLEDSDSDEITNQGKIEF